LHDKAVWLDERSSSAPLEDEHAHKHTIHTLSFRQVVLQTFMKLAKRALVMPALSYVFTLYRRSIAECSFMPMLLW